MEDELIEMRVIVHGHVQGVFFRAEAREYARELGITGTVKNLPDGTVEIFAQGRRQKLDRLLERLQSDSGPGRINSLEKDVYKPVKIFPDFRIIF